MKPLNIIGRKADNASVLAADTMLACELKNNSLSNRQHGESEITRPHYGLKRRVGTNGHQAAALPRAASMGASNPPMRRIVLSVMVLV